MTREPPPLAEARGITKRYGPTVALRDAGIAVRTGASHGLVGRNGAGKSTLVAILTGLERPDAGTVAYDGEPAPAPADRAAWDRRVACVHQRSMVIGELTVAENLFLGRRPVTSRGLPVSWRRLRREARALLDTWGVPVPENAVARVLSVEDAKLVEIARALSRGTRFIILDEPTAQLDGRSAARLFGHMRRLQDAGVTFLYISHRLGEIYEVCRTVTVLRDARRIVTAPVGELPTRALIEAMTGGPAEPYRAPAPAAPPRPGAAGPVAVRIDRLSGPYFHDVSLTLAAGEVVGLAGLAGSGSHQLGAALAGLHRPTGGRIEILGRPLRTGSVPAALAAGVGCLPRDRHTEGLVPQLSVAENITMPVSGRLGPGGLIRPSARDAVARRAIDELEITTEGPAQPVTALSGGNQQKVAMARALATDPRVLVLIDPTAGVDVRSRRALLDVALRARAEGRAVLLVSDQPEDLRACDRVLVMAGGFVTAAYRAGWAERELIAAIEGVPLGHG
ncbi:sugar ABC transporter ATP-binding protein [Streptomyces rapamycinicus]|uniref:Multidrug ABC transporter ATP-binding protein n=2 Tax=Streptomyces rapamycinicus TaxID=1226757 RepID=A0A0A0NUQ8_STRRN|nr:sugar ABC transporter ATP-binding protein [Streptomyces rapamycinicus]AGP60293.1 multidrug ABC transporter ATP-binding protein [Streptomyces rapamycinicus NRRL 5491]MBB4788543.1 simple sugar transport system ATP-binding protein [Streptomyces rapamycinicus]RLV72875.1 multidrug ABC transporter ATP-binding protein [Streptomyces rapamycinicus NRRL 5491]UTP35873.1 sugar ABC transporter ATP-binding protein [Streptomyces rapamycinicus NRRL 5491]